MKNRILSLGMTICMLATVMPAAVLAEAQDSTSCTCEEACTSESKDETCVVCGAEGASEKDCGKYLGGDIPAEGAEDGNVDNNSQGDALASPADSSTTEDSNENPSVTELPEETPSQENSTEEVQPEEIIEEAEETEETAEPVELAAEAGVIDVSTKEELQAALQNNSVNTINIIGSFTYDDAIDTAKKIAVKSGVTFGWNVYQDTFNASPLCIEEGATFSIGFSDFMTQKVIQGSVENNGTIQVTVNKGDVFWSASTTGNGNFISTSCTYISFGSVPESMLSQMTAGKDYKINILADLSKEAVASLPENMVMGDTITPIVSNLNDGISLGDAFTFKWKNGSSFTIYNGAVSPTLTQAGTLKLELGVKSPYIMRRLGNAQNNSLYASGTVAKKEYPILYVDTVNGNNNNLGNTEDVPLKSINKAIENVTENGTIILLSDCTDYTAVFEKSVIVKSKEGSTFGFAPRYTYLPYKDATVTMEGLNFNGLSIYGSTQNAVETVTLNNCSGSITATDGVASLNVENCNLTGSIKASKKLEMNNTTFSGQFFTADFAANGANTLVVKKNAPSRINGTATIQAPITIQMDIPEESGEAQGMKVLEVTDSNKAAVLAGVQLSDIKNGRFALKYWTASNYTYIGVSERINAGGNVFVSYQPVIGTQVKDSYVRVIDNIGLDESNSTWSGYSDEENKTWAAGDIPELTITVTPKTVYGSGYGAHFDNTFDPQLFGLYFWADIDAFPDVSGGKLDRVQILVKDGQGLAEDGSSYTFTLRYPEVERLEQTIDTDCTERRAYCGQILEARTADAKGDISYESSNPEIASVDPVTGQITVHKPGTARIVVKAAQTDLYKAAKVSYELTVDHGAVTAPTIVSDLVYNGKPQELVTAGSTEEGKILYKVGDGEWQEEIPSVKNAGEYTVYYKCVRENGHGETEATPLQVTIAAKKVKVSITSNGGKEGADIIPASASLEGVAEGDSLNVILTYTGTANDGTKVDGTEVPKLAGNYTVTATIADNNYILEPEGITAAFMVESKDAEPTPTPADSNPGNATETPTVTPADEPSVTPMETPDNKNSGADAQTHNSDSQTTSAPKTGDETNAAGYGMALFLSMTALLGAAFARRRKSDKNNWSNRH